MHFTKKMSQHTAVHILGNPPTSGSCIFFLSKLIHNLIYDVNFRDQYSIVQPVQNRKLQCSEVQPVQNRKLQYNEVQPVQYRKYSRAQFSLCPTCQSVQSATTPTASSRPGHTSELEAEASRSACRLALHPEQL